MNLFEVDVIESDVHGYSWASFKLKVKTQAYHRVGSLLLPNNEADKFLQIYFINDRSEQLQRRCSIAMQIEDLLLDTNHLVQQFIIAKDNPSSADFDVVIRAD